MPADNDRLAQAALRRHHIGIKSKSLLFRGERYVFRYNFNHYDVFLNNHRIVSLDTNNMQEAIKMFKQQV